MSNIFYLLFLVRESWQLINETSNMKKSSEQGAIKESCKKERPEK